MVAINIIKNFCYYFCYGFFNIIKWLFKGTLEIIIVIPKFFIKGITFIFTRKWKKESFNKIILVLSIIVYLICVFLVSRWITQNRKLFILTKDIKNSTEIIEKIENDIKKDDIADDNNNITDDDTIISNDRISFNLSSKDFYDVNLTELKRKNSDTIGWIKVNGTKIDYPFVQTDDNEYYLNHNINKTKVNVGWIFGDYRNDMDNFKRNTIIYAHNLTSGQLFGTLPNTLKESWYNNKDNHYINISTTNSNTIWQVISVYVIEPETYYIKTVFTDYEYNEFLHIIKSRSIYDFGYQYTLNDKILTLSTCDNLGKKRMVLHAKLVGIEYK